MTARKTLDTSLDELETKLIQMGKRAEEAVADAIESLINKDAELADKVIRHDEKMNQMDGEIQELCASLIATQQPVAKDLRKILIAIRISNDLERMGDLAVDIAEVTKRVADEEWMKPLVDIPRMAEIVRTMIGDGMQSYLEENVDLAYKMAKMDDDVDHLYSQILRELFVLMIENPKVISQAMHLCFVARFLERIADHATNIGENVVYLSKAVKPDLN